MLWASFLCGAFAQLRVVKGQNLVDRRRAGRLERLEAEVLDSHGRCDGVELVWLDVREQGIQREDDGAKQADGEGRYRGE